MNRRAKHRIAHKSADAIIATVEAFKAQAPDKATAVIIDACRDRVVGEVTASVVARALADHIRCPCDAKHRYVVHSINESEASDADEREADGALAAMVSAHLNHHHSDAITVAEGCSHTELLMVIALGCSILARPTSPIITAHEELDLPRVDGHLL
ncbi:MAG: hypothetical protein ACLFRV_13870 [Acidimicrobiales bacterium]